METLEVTSVKTEDYNISISKELNAFLSDVQIYNMNLRGLHWNIKGRNFFLLHEKYEELYNEADEMVDEIAERILAIGSSPLHTFEDYLANKNLEVAKQVSKGEEGVALVLGNLKHLLRKEREILEKAGENSDEATANLVSDFISNQEKHIWMLESFLS
ncbi:DNA starvation/stationary phase protection protein [Maribacter sp. TH_r10]|uniref:DNA starvation/stationary phase protection protein n=1 Tax=Maribacter luteus TaxID=2594478 RepID=A0A6I2MRM8_9FLAO|nr:MULTISPECIES: DNA starvation/stationary phase protection protein [Maribacter]MDV7139327.1 DNA starvation/stationary phase protection protein [Maribacter sp. TH_r10]MRX65497.1 DNA starvation/stationary phase protection protein [Maribacter luteus]